MTPSRLVQHCDDDTADRLAAEGWTIDRNARICAPYGYLKPHIAYLDVNRRQFFATSDLLAPGPERERGPIVRPAEIAQARNCAARDSRCPEAAYCYPSRCRHRKEVR